MNPRDSQGLAYKINWYWRLCATGFAFALFGIGGLVMGLTVFSVISLIPVSKVWRRRTSRRLVHHCFRLFIYIWRKLGVLSWEAEGIEKLREPNQLIIANHPTLIDVVFLISLIPETNCVVKTTLWKIPFTWGVVSSARFIRNDSGGAVIENCVTELEAGDSLLIFPEGTRSVPGQALTMQRGAANIAVRVEMPLRPVIIDCQPDAMYKGMSWYQIPPRKVHFRFKVLDPIPVADLVENYAKPAAARHLTKRIDEALSSGLEKLKNA